MIFPSCVQLPEDMFYDFPIGEIICIYIYTCIIITVINYVHFVWPSQAN